MVKNITWREFNSQRMSKYMKRFGGHGPAIRQIAKEWNILKKKEGKKEISILEKKIKTIKNKFK